MENNVITVIVAVISSGVLNTIINRIIDSCNKKKDKDNYEKKALRLLMKDRIRFLCMHYIEQGWILDDELDDLISMHKCYHNDLGGNGYLDELMSRAKKLEIRESR